MHEEQATIFEFWFGSEGGNEVPETRRSRWFTRDREFDEAIRERFGAQVEHALEGGFEDWAGTPRGRLALILLLDQFPRNIDRDSPKAFAGDARAEALGWGGIECGHDRALGFYPRAFHYMPFMHSERLSTQRRGVECFTALVDSAPPGLVEAAESFRDYAERHFRIIERFGRFPHRNRILGRTSSPEEQEFLTQPGSSF